ncbi:hypothetical protein Tco_0601176 [Tanacetum coccineum]
MFLLHETSEGGCEHWGLDCRSSSSLSKAICLLRGSASLRVWLALLRVATSLGAFEGCEGLWGGGWPAGRGPGGGGLLGLLPGSLAARRGLEAVVGGDVGIRVGRLAWVWPCPMVRWGGPGSEGVGRAVVFSVPLVLIGALVVMLISVGVLSFLYTGRRCGGLVSSGWPFVVGAKLSRGVQSVSPSG